MRELSKARIAVVHDWLIDYAGASRQFVQESSGFLTLLGFAAIIIFSPSMALRRSSTSNHKETKRSPIRSNKCVG